MLLQTLSTRDPDELAEGFRRWELRFRQFGGGSFRGELKFLQLGGSRPCGHPATGSAPTAPSHSMASGYGKPCNGPGTPPKIRQALWRFSQRALATDTPPYP